MTVQEVINTLLNSVWFYALIVVVLAIIILLVVRSTKKKKLNGRIQDGQISINELKSHPYVLDIAKLDAIGKINDEAANTSIQCKKDYDCIGENIKTATTLLQDANENLEIGDFKSGNEFMDKFEELYNETSSMSKQLDELLTSFLNQEALMRKKINELKSQFHDIKNIVNENPAAYTYCWVDLDKFTESISKQFSEFEAIMEASKYEQANNIADSISENIDKLADMVTELPQLITFAKKTLPTAISELNSNYMVSLSKGVYLQHLNIPKTIDDINSSIVSILSKLKQCEIDGLSTRLNAALATVNQLLAKLSSENQNFNDINKIIKYINNSLSSIEKSVDKVNNALNKEVKRYSLSSINDSLKDIETQYGSLNKDFKELDDQFKNGQQPSSVLIDQFKQLALDCEKCYKDCSKMVELINKNSTEELRAKELISRFVVVLNESKASIRLSRLPSISDKYNEDIALSEKYISEIEQLLAKDTLDVNNLNTLLQTAQNHIINLYKNVNSLINMINIMETYMVKANKYRPFNSKVDDLLYSSELAYRNGEYSKAAKLTNDAINIIDPVEAKAMNEKLLEKANS